MNKIPLVKNYGIDSIVQVISIEVGGAGAISGASVTVGDKSGLVLMYVPDVSIQRAIATLNKSTGNYIK